MNAETTPILASPGLQLQADWAMMPDVDKADAAARLYERVMATYAEEYTELLGRATTLDGRIQWVVGAAGTVLAATAYFVDEVPQGLGQIALVLMSVAAQSVSLLAAILVLWSRWGRMRPEGRQLGQLVPLALKSESAHEILRRFYETERELWTSSIRDLRERVRYKWMWTRIAQGTVGAAIVVNPLVLLLVGT